MTAWEAFALRHHSRGNLWMHLVSFIAFWGGLVMALVTWQPWWLAVWACSGTIGTAGHYLFDDGSVSVKEAAFSPAVPFYVGIMFVRIARGTYFDEVRDIQARHGVAAIKAPHAARA